MTLVVHIYSIYSYRVLILLIREGVRVVEVLSRCQWHLIDVLVRASSCQHLNRLTRVFPDELMFSAYQPSDMLGRSYLQFISA